ncbi:MAG: ABC transporter substrate-binding protein [Devosia sp.]|uniref:ABC transporter substrate-binding protein n=1 Tax=Devosia sp. TaxID=1871048 RepID=UPI001A595B43|nr:ABC transporter substrate-binding protein [Devosia sp.]MBL8598639.1 ABC transporter substrate-binding protein [Devosia sp.]
MQRGRLHDALSTVRSAGLAVAAIAGLALSAPAVAQDKELNWGVRDTPRALFAPYNYSGDVMIMSLIQDQLLTFGTGGELQPALATSWEATDPLTYVYTIRTDAVFSDGTPVTVDDVVYSLNLHLDPAVGSQEASLFGSVESVSGEGDKVTVKLKEPSSLWKYIPASIGGYIWQKSSVEKDTKNYGSPQNLPVGSGPYMVTEYVADSHVTLVRNPHYWGAAPQFDKITFTVLPDDQTRFLALQQGDIDGTFNVPNTALAQWSSVATLTNFPSYIWRGLTVDMEQAPFNDIHVRKALNYAIDKQALAAGLLGGLAVPSSTVNDPGIFVGTLPQADIDAAYGKLLSFPYDLEKAKEEMAASSVPNGFATTLNVPEDSATISQIAQAIKQSWAAIGVDLTLNMMPGGPRFQIILDHEPNLGVQVIGNVPDAPDPVQMALQYFSSVQAVKNGNNSSNLKDPKIDEVLDNALKATDPAEAARLVLEAQVLASEQVPVVPLIWQKSVVALKQGWTMDDLQAFWNMSVWVNKLKTN